MKPEDKQYIFDNIGKKSVKQIAKDLGIKEKKIKKFLKNEEGKAPETASPKGAKPTQYKIRLLHIILIALVGFTIYVNSFGNDFVYDDEILVVNNVYIRGLQHIKEVFTTDLHVFDDPGLQKGNFYRPIVALFFMLDYFLWKLEPLGYHITNTLLHIFNAILIYLIVQMLLRDSRVALICAILFVIHPIHVEAVAYIAGRADLIAVFFLLLSFYFYVKKDKDVGRSKSHYRASIIFFTLALLSKELSLMLIFLFILYDYCFNNGRRLSAVIQKKIHTYLPFIAVIAVYFWIRTSVLDLGHAAAQEPLYIRLLTTATIIIGYFRLMIFPTNLHMERMAPIKVTIFDPQVLFSIIFLVFLSVLIARSRRRSKTVFFASLWFFIALFPFCNIIPLNANMAEHWLYLPSIGFFLLAAIGMVKLLDVKISPFNTPIFKSFIIGLIILACTYYSFLTMRQNTTWKNAATFYKYTIPHSPHSFRIRVNLGNIYLERGQLEEAMKEHEAALEMKPDEYQIHTNLGVIYFRMNKLDKAVEKFSDAISIYPNDPYAHNNLGLVYQRMGESDKAIERYKKAIQVFPDYFDAHCNLAKTYSNKGMLLEAKAEWQEALRVNPYSPGVKKEIERLEKILSGQR